MSDWGDLGDIFGGTTPDLSGIDWGGGGTDPYFGMPDIQDPNSGDMWGAPSGGTGADPQADNPLWQGGNADDWARLVGGGGSGGAGVLGNAASGLASLFKSLGISPASLLPLLAGGAGAVYANRQTGKAANQVNQGIQAANAAATTGLNGASAMYQPYADAGGKALATLSSQAPSNLASRYAPIGGNLGWLAKGGK